jgi:hypothetical protein
MKRIGIIGAPCIDEVISPKGELTSTQLGGVLYSYAAMERLIESAGLDVHVVPLTFISIADAPLLEQFFLGLKHFDLSAAPRTYDALSNRVKLLYHEDNSRSEFCASILPELRPEHLSSELLGSLDGLFINMISGFDISVETLAWIRSHTKAYIHLDVHALVLGDLSKHPSGSRIPRGVKQWREWIRNVDSAQLNEMESDWFGVPDTTSEMELLREIRMISKETGSPQSVIITRAERGATSFDFRHEKIWNKAATTKEIRNTTGSGDVFGAVYCLSKSLGTSEEHSLWQAEEIAGWNAGLGTLDEILTAQLQLGSDPRSSA